MSLDKTSDSQLYNNSSEDFIPIACHFDEHTLITKNGELLQTIQINGINSEKISSNLFNLREVVRKSINKSIDSQEYAFWIHTIRRKTDLDDTSDYYSFLSANIHDIWRRKNYWHDKFVNRLYITVVHGSPELKLKNFSSLVNSLSSKAIINFEERFFLKALQNLTKTVDSLLEGLIEYGAHRLGIRIEGEDCYSDPMFLYRRIMHLNENDCPVPISDISIALASHQYAVGSDKIEVIGDGKKKFAALMSIKEYQEVSSEALDRFLQIPVEMIATEVFYFVNKKEVIPIYENQNYILKISKDDELRKVKGLDKIFDDQDHNARFCHQQISFMVVGEDLKMLDKQVSQASEALAKIGIVHVREDINLEKTFWAQLPANFSFLARMKPTIIDNTAALASLHNFPTGNQFNPWGRAVTILRTERGTPYFTNFHDKSGSGTTCIFGDKKSGKTTLLNFLLSEADKYMPTIMYITDDMDSDLYIKAKGWRLFAGDKNIINPLLFDDTPKNRQYLLEFFKIIAKHYFDPLKDGELDLLPSLCEQVFKTKPQDRKLSKIISKIKSDTDGKALSARLKDYVEGGLYHDVFEATEPIQLSAGEVVAINLQAFDDAEYIKAKYPKEKKLIEKFEYDLQSMRSVKTAIVLATQNLMLQSGSGPKIFAVDNFTEIINLKYYQHLVKYTIDEISSMNGVSVFTLNTSTLKAVEDEKVAQNWLGNINTSFILPSEMSVAGLDKIVGLSAAELKKLSSMSVSSHMFLIKQDEKTIASELSIGGLLGLVKILCSGESERELYKEVVKEFGDKKPEDWVETLYKKLENIT